MYTIVTKTSPVNVVYKDWGREEILVNSAACNYSAKMLVLHRGKTTSLHFHRKKKETLIVVEGSCTLEMGNELGELGQQAFTVGDMITIGCYQWHRLFARQAISCGPCRLLEVSSHNDEEDIVRSTKSGDLDEVTGKLKGA